MTDRRVNVELTIPTDLDELDVLQSVLFAIRSNCDLGVENISAHAFDLDEADEAERTVCLILTGNGIQWADGGTDRAEEIAAAASGVVVDLPVTADYRKDTR